MKKEDQEKKIQSCDLGEFVMSRAQAEKHRDPFCFRYGDWNQSLQIAGEHKRLHTQLGR